MNPGAVVPTEAAGKAPAALPAAGKKAAEPGLLDRVLEATREAGPSPAGTALEQFLKEPSPWEALGSWLQQSNYRGRPEKDQVARWLNHDIARLDAVLSRQVNAILHHPQFQKLEASWRGLRFLVDQVPEGENIKIRVLNVTWKELTRDLERAIEFDQSQMFHKVYSDEFGMPGGEPFSVLLGDYEIYPRPGPDHPTDDLSTLGKIAGVAAASFAPFLAGIHPSFLDLESFAELERPLDLSRTLEQVQYVKWKALRGTDDARFVGLVMPRVLMRLPYEDSASRVDRFRFREEVAGPDRKGYLWGNAVYSFGSILVHSFSECSWLADIRGVPQDERSGGLVSGLPVQSFRTDSLGVAVKSSTDARITDRQEKELADLGLIPLSYCPDTEISAFFSNQSIQQARKYDDPVATANARLSVMLQYMLCVARFTHYLKVMARDKVGSFTD
ncbi:MAG: type VI secretion system contractile sheath large subunit, partial [Planctomycetes bacterium]|nr:type VI secretion system contractile sheath large subunit [Planctomycetota bacterium]